MSGMSERLDLEQIRRRVALGGPGDVTTVDLGFLGQVAKEIEAGRAAEAELQRLQAREGMTFGRPTA